MPMVEYYLAIKKGQVTDSFDNMDEPQKHFANESTQSQRVTYYMIPLV